MQNQKRTRRRLKRGGSRWNPFTWRESYNTYRRRAGEAKIDAALEVIRTNQDGLDITQKDRLRAILDK